MGRRWDSIFLALGMSLAAACAGGVSAQPAAGRPDEPPALKTEPGLHGVKAARDVVYASPDGKPQLLDLYVPEKADGLLPLVIWIHGGGWKEGDKRKPPALPMTVNGYAVASVNYRLTDVAKWPAQIYDCKAAVRWLRAHARDYNLAPDRFGAWGMSAGGHLVALLGTSGGVKELEGGLGNAGVSSRLQAVCDWCGPADFTTIEEGKSIVVWDRPGSPTFMLFGGPIRENLDAARQASPVTWVTKDAPPFLIMHGDKDDVVPFSQGEALAAALKRAGAPVKFIPVAGGGHGFFSPATTKFVGDFFDEQLKPKK